jgi:hypothetical protein
MRRSDYDAMGGHMAAIRPIDEVLTNIGDARIAGAKDQSWPLAQSRFAWSNPNRKSE